MDRTSYFNDYVSLASQTRKQPARTDSSRSNASLHREYLTFLQKAVHIKHTLQSCSVNISDLEALDASSSSFESMDVQVDRRIQQINTDIQTISHLIEDIARFNHSSNFNSHFMVFLCTCLYIPFLPRVISLLI